MKAVLAPILALLLAVPAACAPLDLAAAISTQCGPPGYKRDGGCRVRLPRGSLEVRDTIRLGDCTARGTRNSLVIEGESMGGLATVPRFPIAGTTLVWKGGARPVIDACGTSYLSLRDFAIDGAGATIAIRVSSDNRAAATSHFVELKDIAIDGALTGVQVTGRNLNDQTDFVTLDRVSILNVQYGYVQDSGQSVGGNLDTVEVTATREGYRIEDGSLTCRGCYVGSLPAPAGVDPKSFIGFHLTGHDSPRGAHHQVHISDSHMELQRGRFIVSDAFSLFGITLIGNSYSLQCAQPGCEMAIVDSIAKAPLVMIGETIQASSNPPANPKARICHRGTELVQLGTNRKPEVSQLIVGCQ